MSSCFFLPQTRHSSNLSSHFAELNIVPGIFRCSRQALILAAVGILGWAGGYASSSDLYWSVSLGKFMSIWVYFILFCSNLTQILRSKCDVEYEFSEVYSETWKGGGKKMFLVTLTETEEMGLFPSLSILVIFGLAYLGKKMKGLPT